MTREEMIAIKEERGYSLKSLSRYSGVPVVTLQKVFSGKTKNPRKSTLQAIEKVLTGDEDVYSGKAFSYEMASKAWNRVIAVREEAAVYGKLYSVLSSKKQGEFTVADYREIPDEKRYELIDGVLFEMNAPSIMHQKIIYSVHKAIDDFILEHGGDCQVFEAPVDVQIECDDKTMVQPDVLVVCDPSKIRQFGIFGAPDLLIEVLSPSTRNKDIYIKAKKYWEAGVKEYWIIDPNRKMLIIHLLQEDHDTPQILPLAGTAPVFIFQNLLQIDLGAIAAIIDRFEKLPK